MMKLVCHYCHNYIIYIAYLLFIPSLPLSIKYYFSCCHDGSTKEKKISLDPEVARKKRVKRESRKIGSICISRLYATQHHNELCMWSISLRTVIMICLWIKPSFSCFQRISRTVLLLNLLKEYQMTGFLMVRHI